MWPSCLLQIKTQKTWGEKSSNHISTVHSSTWSVEPEGGWPSLLYSDLKRMVQESLRWHKPLDVKSWHPRCRSLVGSPSSRPGRSRQLSCLLSKAFTEWIQVDLIQVTWISSFVNSAVGLWICQTCPCHSIWLPPIMLVEQLQPVRGAVGERMHRENPTYSTFGWWWNGKRLVAHNQFPEPISKGLRQIGVWLAACDELAEESENYKGRWAEEENPKLWISERLRGRSWVRDLARSNGYNCINRDAGLIYGPTTHSAVDGDAEKV